MAARIANYCDHAEHLEACDRSVITEAGTELRNLATELARERDIDIVDRYRLRLDAVERRHPLYPADYAAIDHIQARGATWRLLQRVQWEHDRHYHPDVLGLSRYEQLRHYAFHLSKLAGAAAVVGSGDDETDFLERRLPDVLLFGLKLATLVNETLADVPVS